MSITITNKETSTMLLHTEMNQSVDVSDAAPHRDESVSGRF